MHSTTSQSQGLLHFRLSLNQSFAIGTLKVREIVPCMPLTPLPHSHPNVLGSTSLRGLTLSVIDLPAAVGYRPITPEERQSCSIIVVDVCRQTVGFMVRGIDKITECRWDDIDSVPASVGRNAFISGVTRSDDKLIQLLDIEMLLESIFPDEFIQDDISISLADQAMLSRCEILLVDDSPTARRQLKRALDSIEVSFQMVDNGRHALEVMEQAAADDKPIQILVSDIEMPGLDGYELTFEVRSNPKLADAFIILHTSLSSEISVDRAKQVGANDALTKFNAPDLIAAMLQGAGKFKVGDASHEDMSETQEEIDKLI